MRRGRRRVGRARIPSRSRSRSTYLARPDRDVMSSIRQSVTIRCHRGVGCRGAAAAARVPLRLLHSHILCSHVCFRCFLHSWRRMRGFQACAPFLIVLLVGRALSALLQMLILAVHVIDDCRRNSIGGRKVVLVLPQLLRDLERDEIHLLIWRRFDRLAQAKTARVLQMGAAEAASDAEPAIATERPNRALLTEVLGPLRKVGSDVMAVAARVAVSASRRLHEGRAHLHTLFGLFVLEGLAMLVHATLPFVWIAVLSICISARPLVCRLLATRGGRFEFVGGCTRYKRRGGSWRRSQVLGLDGCDARSQLACHCSTFLFTMCHTTGAPAASTQRASSSPLGASWISPGLQTRQLLGPLYKFGVPVRVRWGRPLLNRPRGAVGSGPAALESAAASVVALTCGLCVVGGFGWL